MSISDIVKHVVYTENSSLIVSYINNYLCNKYYHKKFHAFYHHYQFQLDILKMLFHFWGIITMHPCHKDLHT